MYYHASQVKGIKVLEPRISNHNIPLVYLSYKRENTLVYLSNESEKLCREKGFSYEENWYKYSCGKVEEYTSLELKIPDAVVSAKGVQVVSCETVDDALSEMLKAEAAA